MQDQLLEAQRLNDALRAEREIYVNMNQVGNAPQRYAISHTGWAQGENKLKCLAFSLKTVLLMLCLECIYSVEGVHFCGCTTQHLKYHFHGHRTHEWFDVARRIVLVNHYQKLGERPGCVICIV